VGGYELQYWWYLTLSIVVIFGVLVVGIAFSGVGHPKGRIDEMEKTRRRR
jgi:hypothetical protein